MSTARVDGRNGIDGLSALVRSQFVEDPLSGTMYVFFSRGADGVRVVYFDRDAYVLITKRLEKGFYRVPWSAGQDRVVIEGAELLQGGMTTPDSAGRTAARTHERLRLCALLGEDVHFATERRVPRVAHTRAKPDIGRMKRDWCSIAKHGSSSDTS